MSIFNALRADIVIQLSDSLWTWCNKYRPMDRWFHISWTSLIKFASDLSFREWFTAICRRRREIESLGYVESLNRSDPLIECRVREAERDVLVTRENLQMTIHSVEDAKRLLQFVYSELQAYDRATQHNREAEKVMESLQEEVKCVRGEWVSTTSSEQHVN